MRQLNGFLFRGISSRELYDKQLMLSWRWEWKNKRILVYFHRISPNGSMLTLVHLPIVLLPFRFMRPVRLRKRNTSSMMRRFVTFLWGNSFNMMLLSVFSVSVLPCNN